jgi:hypothetical protein
VSEESRYATVVAAFTTVLYLAMLVATFGLISLYANLDVIDLADAGPLVGPTMSGVAMLVVFAFLVSIGRGATADNQRLSAATALGVGFAVYAVFVLSGGVVYAVGNGQPLEFLTFTFHEFGSWFSIAAGILAVIATFVYQAVLVGRFQQRGRPQWPWERKGP